jgi:hypothetical protein
MAELLKEETTTALHRGIRTWRLGNIASRVRPSQGDCIASYVQTGQCVQRVRSGRR